MGGCTHKLLPPIPSAAHPGCAKLHDVFVSYHHCTGPDDFLSDFSQHFAEWIAEVCTRLGLDTVLDKTNLSRIINEQGLRLEILSSYVVVGVVSREALLDPNGMQQELSWAHNASIPIVPFYDGDRHTPEAYASWQREFAFALRRLPVVYRRRGHLRAERALVVAVHDALREVRSGQLPDALVAAAARAGAAAARVARRAAPAQPGAAAARARASDAAVRAGALAGQQRPPRQGRTDAAGVRLDFPAAGEKRFRFQDGEPEAEGREGGGVSRLLRSLRETLVSDDQEQRSAKMPEGGGECEEQGPFTPRHRTLKPTRGILKGSRPQANTAGTSAPSVTAAPPGPLDKQMQQGIARLREYLEGLRKSDAGQLPTVLRVLELMQPNEDVAKCALAAVFEFVQDAASCRQAVAQHGGIKSIVAVMSTHRQSISLQTYGCGCLYALSCFRPDNPQKDNNSAAIAHAGGIGRLLEAMSTFPICREVQEWGVGALRHLAVEIGNNRREISDGGEVQLTMRSINKRMIAKTGGIELIAKAMQKFPDDVELQENGCAALCNLTSSRQDNKVRAARAGCIRAAIGAMKTFPAEPDLTQLACALLRSLAQGVPENKVAIVAQGGVRELCQAMAKNRGDPEVNVQAVAALCNLTSQVSENKHAICQAGGLELAIAALHALPDSAELQQQGCGLLHNIACERMLKAQVLAAGGLQVANAACQYPERTVQQLGVMLRQQLREAAECESEQGGEEGQEDGALSRKAKMKEEAEAGVGVEGLFSVRRPGSRSVQSKTLTRPQRRVMADLLASMRQDPQSWLPENSSNSGDEAKSASGGGSSAAGSEASGAPKGLGLAGQCQAAEYGVEDLEGLSDREGPSGDFDFIVRRGLERQGRTGTPTSRDKPSSTSSDCETIESAQEDTEIHHQDDAGKSAGSSSRDVESSRTAAAAPQDAKLTGRVIAAPPEHSPLSSCREEDAVSQDGSEATDGGWVDIFEDANATKRIKHRVRRNLRRVSRNGKVDSESEGAALLRALLDEVDVEEASIPQVRVKRSKSQVAFAKALRLCGDAPPERWECEALKMQARAAKGNAHLKGVAVLAAGVASDSATAVAALRDGLDGLARVARQGLGRGRPEASADTEAEAEGALRPERPEQEDDESSIYGVDGLRELGEAEVALLDALGAAAEGAKGGGQREVGAEAPTAGRAAELKALSNRLQQRREERRRVKLL